MQKAVNEVELDPIAIDFNDDVRTLNATDPNFVGQAFHVAKAGVARSLALSVSRLIFRSALEGSVACASKPIPPAIALNC